MRSASGMRPYVFCLITALAPLFASAQGALLSSTANAFELLGPPRVAGPTVLTTSLHLQDIDEIDDGSETVLFSGTLLIRWHDPRQVFNPDSAGVPEKFFNDPYQYNEQYPTWIPQVELLNAYAPLETRNILLRITPDGNCTLIRSINGTAKAQLELRRYPFDKQQLQLTFHVHGFRASEVQMVTAKEPITWNSAAKRIPQWTVDGIDVAAMDLSARAMGEDLLVSGFVVTLDVTRDPFHMLRLVILPLALIVILSWSVFWMDRSSLGDRMGVSFVGILTAVTYQVIIADTLPDISYMTFIHGFVNLSFLLMCFTVVANILVGVSDRTGLTARGDRIDRVSRWLFPMTYLLILVVNYLYFR